MYDFFFNFVIYIKCYPMNCAWIKKDLKIIIKGHILNWPWRSREERRKTRGEVIQEYWKNEDGTADYFVHQLLFKMVVELTRNSFYQKVEYKSKYARKPVKGSFSDIMQNMYR